MAKKVVIKDGKSYIANRFKCEEYAWKAIDPKTRIGWCKVGNCPCRANKCYKLKQHGKNL